MRAITASYFVMFMAFALNACTHLGGLSAPNEQRIRGDIAFFSKPEMQGRMSGGPAEEAVLTQLENRMKDAGLTAGYTSASSAKPAVWRQPVDLWNRVALDSNVSLTDSKNRTYALPDQDIFLTGEENEMSGSKWPLIFMGRDLPADMDLSAVNGAVAIMETPADESTRTERNNRLRVSGARGVIEIVSGKATMERIVHYWQRPHFYRPKNDNALLNTAPFIEGVVSEQRAVVMVNMAGLDWDRMHAAAKLSGFKGLRISLVMNFKLTGKIEQVSSANLIGVKRGTQPASGAIIIMAHWDHLGHCRTDQAGKPVICPGAIDNSSGLAAMLALAEAIKHKKLDRDVYFLATTAEEFGFSGARAFIADPPVPTEQMVAIFNLDMLAVGAQNSPVAILGDQNAPLDDAIKDIIRESGLQLTDSDLAQEYVARQDGWPFLQAGLPARMISSSFGDAPLLSHFVATSYHGPTDRYEPSMQLGGLLQDVKLHTRLILHFASTSAWPL